MLKSPVRALVIVSFLVTGISVVQAADPNTCSSSFYCYGSTATPAGATPVRVVVEGSNNQGTLIENVRRDVVAAPARPLAPVRTPVVIRPSVTRTTNLTPTNTARPVLASPVVTLATRPSVLDANIRIAAPVRRVIVQPTTRTQAQPTTRTTTTRLAPRPINRRVATTSASTNSCDSLISKANKAESQGVIFAKTGQPNLSRQSFQAAAGFRSQAKSLNCSV